MILRGQVSVTREATEDTNSSDAATISGIPEPGNQSSARAANSAHMSVFCILPRNRL
jgi:hypothetical protein